MGTDLPGTACFAPVIDTWHLLAGDGGELPPDRSFWADRLTDFAGRISVLLPEDDGRDFFYVIYAGAIVDAGGVDMTGFRVSDFPFAGVREALSRCYRSTLRHGVPEIWRTRHDWRGQLYDYCLLVLPVRHVSSGRTRLHVLIVNTDPRRRRLYKAGFLPGREILKPDDLR
ncbi:MAG: hypothetical protein VYB54_12315 [Pseudomonadota bacterium]|nr:hypothetical protein [Pseudomonadota bacterium]